MGDREMQSVNKITSPRAQTHTHTCIQWRILGPPYSAARGPRG